MFPTVEVLLRSVVDYAGTFPPAKLELADALATYARARAGKHAWMLGRCIFPASQLQEFERLAPTLLSGGSKEPVKKIANKYVGRALSGPPGRPDQPPPRLRRSAKAEGSALRDFFPPRDTDRGLLETDRGPWPLSLIATGEASELEAVQDFSRRWQGKAVIAALELRPLTAAQIEQVARGIPEGVEAFFEVPIDGEFDARVAQVARDHARVKIRTGGIVAAAFPGPTELVRCMRSCAEAGVAFKASAGLHHATGGHYALTYEPDSARANMYGFLNIGVAAALVHLRAPSTEAVEALQESSAQAFRFTQDALIWRDRRIAVADLAGARRSVFRSFGSCAFGEPVEDLERLGIL